VELEASKRVSVGHYVNTIQVLNTISYSYPQSTTVGAPWLSIGLVNTFTLSNDDCTVKGYNDGELGFSYTHKGPLSFTYTFNTPPI